MTLSTQALDRLRDATATVQAAQKELHKVEAAATQEAFDLLAKEYGLKSASWEAQYESDDEGGSYCYPSFYTVILSDGTDLNDADVDDVDSIYDELSDHVGGYSREAISLASTGGEDDGQFDGTLNVSE